MAYAVAGVLMDDTTLHADSVKGALYAAGSPKKLYCVWAEASDGDPANSRIYYRRWDGSAFAAAKSDVSGSGPVTYGWDGPDVKVLNDSRVIVGYNYGDPVLANLGRGFRVKESPDGVTWGNEYTFPSHTNHVFLGLATDGVNAYALSMTIPTATTYTISLHRRNGPGNWSSQVIFTGNTTSWYDLVASPQQCMIVEGPSVCIVGCKSTTGQKTKLNALIGQWGGGTFSEVNIYTQAISIKRVARLVYSGGTIYGVANSRRESATTEGIAQIFYSTDHGNTWTVLSEPTSFTSTDSFGTAVVWPDPTGRVEPHFLTLASDNNGYLWITHAHYDATGVISARIHRYQVTAMVPSSVTLQSSQTSPTSGSAVYNNSSTGITSYDGASAFLGRDFYRLVPALDTVTAYTELQLLKDANTTTASKGGGSAIPARFAEP